MAESPPQPTPPPPPPENDHDPPPRHWCHNCNKRVLVETLTDSTTTTTDIICRDCKQGFLETIPSSYVSPSSSASMATYRELRSALHAQLGLGGSDDEDGESEYDEDDEEDDDDEDEDGAEEEDEDYDSDAARLMFQRLSLPRTWSGERNQFFRGAERNIGNPGDYLDGPGYAELLSRLADSDDGSKRGAPPASRSVVEALVKESVEVDKEGSLVECAVCMYCVGVGGLVTKLPCGHGYHGDCIVPWLEVRNSCPVCRFELETDDAEYEEQRRCREAMRSVGGSAS